MKKYIIMGILLVLATSLFSANITAVIKDISGKVEVMTPGGNWQKATEGMEIKTGYFISTGFRSEAVLTLGSSQVVVKQLTRMKLEELVEKEGTVSTSLNLRVGKIKAEVRTTAGLRQNFRLTSPVSTAAVRGTSFEYDGLNLTVTEGTVFFSNRLGQGRSIGKGEKSKIFGAGLPRSSEEMNILLANIDPSTLTILKDLDLTTILDGLNNLTNVSIILNWGN